MGTVSTLLSRLFLFTVLAFSAYICFVGIQDGFTINKQENNQCLMSWMRPNYIPLKISSKFAYKYNLFLYREGLQNAEEHKTKGVKLVGVPVLFVHGHAGSYAQARSLGVAVDFSNNEEYSDSHIGTIKVLTETRGLNYSVGLDVFTIDFQEELSALHGNLLWDQAEFVNDCIQFILDLYKSNKHSSVLTVGHSMGGMILRGALTLPNYKKGSVNTIITLSTPHREHPLLTDRTTQQFYRKVNTAWRNPPANSNIEDVAIVSIGGGFRDTLIRSDATIMDGIVSPSNGFSIFTYGIPNVRVSTDHLSITWCKQLIQSVAISLLELVNHKDNSNNKYDLPLEKRLAILKHHFNGNVATNFDFVPGVNEKAKVLDREDVFGSEAVVEYFDAFRVIDNSVNNKNFKLNVTAILEAGKDAIFFVSNTNRLEFQIYGSLKSHQDKLQSLDSLIEILPYIRKREHHMEALYYPAELPHTVALIKPSILAKFSEIYVRLENIVQDYNILKFSYSTISTEDVSASITPHMRDLFLGKSLDIRLDASRGFYNLTLDNLAPHLVYKAQVKYSPKCPADKMLLPSSLYISSSSTGQPSFFEERFIENATSFDMKFFLDPSNPSIQLMLFTQPHEAEDCFVDVSISLSYKGIFEYLFRFNALQVIAFVFIMLLFTLAYQTFNGFQWNMIQSMTWVFFSRMVPIWVILFAIRNTLNVRQLIVFADQVVTQIIEKNFKFDYVAPKSPLDPELVILHRFDQLHYTSMIYTILSSFVAFAAITVVYIAIAILTKVVFKPVGLILSGVISLLGPRINRLLNYIWWLSIASLFTALILYTNLHSGILLTVLFLIMLVHVSATRSSSSADTTRLKNLRTSILILALFCTVVLVPSMICWVRELVIHFGRYTKSNNMADIWKAISRDIKNPSLHSYVADLLVNKKDFQFKLLGNLDTEYMFFLPLIWCVAFCFMKDIHMKVDEVYDSYNWVLSALMFEVCGSVMTLFGLFGVYRVVYVIPFFAVAVILNCMFSTPKLAKKPKHD